MQFLTVPQRASRTRGTSVETARTGASGIRRFQGAGVMPATTQLGPNAEQKHDLTHRALETKDTRPKGSLIKT